jgi:hypothetical protein
MLVLVGDVSGDSCMGAPMQRLCFRNSVVFLLELIDASCVCCSNSCCSSHYACHYVSNGHIHAYWVTRQLMFAKVTSCSAGNATS